MRRVTLALLIVAAVSLAAFGAGELFHLYRDTAQKSAQTLDALRSDLAQLWAEEYRRDIYDCSNMAAFVAAYLQEVKGFDTEVLFSEAQNHAWVRVRNVEGRHHIVETTSSFFGFVVSDASLYKPSSTGFNYNLYDDVCEWYEFMNRWERLYIDLHRKHTRLIREYNELVGKYNRLRG